MTGDLVATSQTRRTYDHRIREQVCRTGKRCLPRHLAIPRSTVSSWHRRGVRAVVTIEPFDQDRQELLDTIAKLDRRARVLAAVVRLLLALLRASGFSLAGGQRLPEGNAKAGILRAITSANPFLPLAVILRIAHLEPGRYHVWKRASRVVCGLDDRSSCPHTSPSQLMPAEVANIKDMVLAPEYRHMPVSTLAVYAQRIGKVFASASTWGKLIRERGWLRPRQRVHPAKPTIGVRATAPNKIWHIDTTILKLLDGTKAYLRAVIDNYSRKILAWTVTAQLEPTATCQILFTASKHLVCAGQPVLYVDSGVENINSAVDAALFAACLNRVLAQVEVTFSNSMIEAFWRSLKHQWLYLNSLDSIERLRTLVAFFIEQYNTQMPHPAFSGQTPDEMYFITAVDLPAQLAAARSKAREERLAANRAMSCNQCIGQQASLPESPIPP
jgi:transposase InsO family protein